MTITLHWWILPIALVVVGLWYLYRPYRGYDDLGNRIAGVVLIAVAIAFTVGHFT